MPSLPANGLVFTENVISTVGSEIFTKGSGSGQLTEQIVSTDGNALDTGEAHDIADHCARQPATLFRPVELVEGYDLRFLNGAVRDCGSRTR